MGANVHKAHDIYGTLPGYVNGGMTQKAVAQVLADDT
jgi:hypothetical protein